VRAGRAEDARDVAIAKHRRAERDLRGPDTVNLGQESSWSPTGVVAQAGYVLGAIFGWALVAVILGTLTARLIRD
jgi:hypothetical protein